MNSTAPKTNPTLLLGVPARMAKHKESVALRRLLRLAKSAEKLAAMKTEASS